MLLMQWPHLEGLYYTLFCPGQTLSDVSPTAMPSSLMIESSESLWKTQVPFLLTLRSELGIYDET